MEEWDPVINDFVLRCNSCWGTNKNKHLKLYVLHVKNIIVNGV